LELLLSRKTEFGRAFPVIRPIKLLIEESMNRRFV